MIRPSWLERDWDLLRQRRLERGLPPAIPQLRPAKTLLLRGTALGGGLVAAVLLLSGWLQLRQQQVAVALEAARGVPAQVQALESKALALRRQLSGLNRSSEGLAKGLVAVSSGSALLAELSAITPVGVQFTDVQVEGNSLVLKGLAADPQAFRRVNALSLSLARSPLLEPGAIKVVKLSRDGGAQSASAEPVQWSITAKFAVLQSKQQLEVLQQLGAQGLARRLLLLQRAGVLP
jgi:type IV pilus assembly protein PilN